MVARRTCNAKVWVRFLVPALFNERTTMSGKEQFLKNFVQILKDNEGTLTDGFNWYVDHDINIENAVSIEQNLMRIGSLVWDSIEDQKRFDWLLEKLKFSLGGYTSKSGNLEDASDSMWRLKTDYIFDGVNKPPEDIRQAISIAMNEEV